MTVTKADGSSVEIPALSEKQVRLVSKERRPVSPTMRSKVLLRDRGACRYCGSEGPLEIDHVVPVALGGTSRIGNLVAACVDCNRRKGASVWKPKPVGVFGSPGGFCRGRSAAARKSAGKRDNLRKKMVGSDAPAAKLGPKPEFVPRNRRGATKSDCGVTMAANEGS